MQVSLHSVSYSYAGSKKDIFREVSYQFEPGVTILKGYSGCGKSTLLRLVSGLLLPTRGKVECGSRYRHGSAAYLRKEVGFVFQQLNLLPLASVRRNAELAARMAGKSPKEASHWLEVLGISEYAKRRPSELSGGQQQRAAVARALAKMPSLLLLDEPTSGLDDENTEVIKRVISEELPSGTTCLIATHDSRLLHLTDAILDFNTDLPFQKLPSPVV